MLNQTIKEIHLVLYYKEQGESRAEIARLTDMPASLVKTRLGQVTEALAKRLLPDAQLQGNYPILVDELREDAGETQVEADAAREGRTVARETFRNEHVWQSLIQDISQVMAPAKPNPVPKTVRKSKNGSDLWAVISDVHFGKNTDNYDSTLARQIVQKFFLRMIDEIHPGVSTLNLCLLGDILDGTGIYRTQITESDMTATEQFSYVLKVLTDCISWILSETTVDINIVGIAGNHGRVNTPEVATWENFEALLYRTIELFFKNEPRVSSILQTREAFCVIHKRVFLFHGHEIQGGGTLDGIINRVRNWQTLYQESPFDISVCGHFHRLMSAVYPTNKIHLANGTSVKGDMFIQRLGASHSNMWWMFETQCTSDRTEITRLIPVELY